MSKFDFLEGLNEESIKSLRAQMIDELVEYPRNVVFEVSEAGRIAHQQTVKDQNVKRLREKTNTVTDNRLLVAFLYILMRDTVPPGVIEGTLLKLSNDNVEDKDTKHEYTLTNGYLAQYAQDIADRLDKNRLTGDIEQSPYEDKFKR